jgi:molybdate transport system substrate-binding protein
MKLNICGIHFARNACGQANQKSVLQRSTQGETMSDETQPLVLFSTLAVQGALVSQIIPQFEATYGIKITTVFDPTRVLMQHISQGSIPDVIVAVTADIEQLVREQTLEPKSPAKIARTGVGVAICDGAVAPPIHDVQAFTAALLDARSVAYSRTGASGLYFAELITRLGIADRINAKATIVEKGFTGLTLLDGRADLAIQQLSELKLVKGINVIGPLPQAVQHFTEFSAALGLREIHHPYAEHFIQLLSDNAMTGVYLSTGLELPIYL